jgi:hypothetical protein
MEPEAKRRRRRRCKEVAKHRSRVLPITRSGSPSYKDGQGSHFTYMVSKKKYTDSLQSFWSFL